MNGRLHRRIAQSGTTQQRAMGGYHPWGTAATPMVMPLAVVTQTQDGVTYQEMTPLVTTDGAIIPATAPGSWGQLHAAGRP